MRTKFREIYHFFVDVIFSNIFDSLEVNVGQVDVFFFLI